MSRELPEQLQFLANRKAVQKTTTASLKGRLAVITGSTSGVGLAGARRLAQAGCDLVLVARNRAKAEALASELRSAYAVAVSIVLADLRDLDEVRRAAATLLRECPRIDILINSAGLHSTTLTRTPDGRETVFCVNHLAPFLLTSLLLERMRESSPSRIIQVNSEGHRFGGLDPADLDWERRHYTGLRGYGASKIAQLLTTWEFADLLEGSRVTINAMHPGDLRTNIGSNNGPLYRWFLHTVTWRFLKDPAIAGEALYYLAAAPELAGTSGRYFHVTLEERPTAQALDRALGKVIWEKSQALTGLAQLSKEKGSIRGK